jgi:hypothetical protein
MKQLFLTLIIALASVNAMADKTDTMKVDNSTVVNQSPSKDKKAGKNDSTFVPEYVDTAEDGTTVVSTSADRYDDSYDDNADFGVVKSFLFGLFGRSAGIVLSGLAVFFMLIPLVFILLPIIILFMIFRYNNKRRMERYKLIEKSMETGQPLPQDIAGDVKTKEDIKELTDGRKTGIKNMCLGGGLFVFLWAVTHSLGVACIGVLVFARGLGQYLTSEEKPVGNSRVVFEDEKKEDKENKETEDNGNSAE